MKNRVFLIVYAFIFFCRLTGAVQDTVSIHSNSMGKDLPCLIVLPDEYFVNAKRFPVVYLLHGYGGNYLNWSEHTNLGNYADSYNIIITCPEGGYNSWYLNSPMESESQFKTHVGQEVIQYIDTNYRTLPQQNSRAITGLSMGGHGALYLALEFPDVFGAAGSMSGVVDLKVTSKQYELGEKIGSIEKFPKRWDYYSINPNAIKFKTGNTKIIIDCGVDDVLIECNRVLHEKLLELDIPHEYFEKAGGHSWEYWVSSLDYHLLYFNKVFKNH